MPADAPTAFFSYSREDSEFALRLAEDLKAAGAGVWIDQLDIEPGQEWDNAIEDAVTQCPRMLLILTVASVKSKKVRNEIAFALDEQKTIIPVLYQDCVVPLQLRRIQHIDFRVDYGRGLKALLKTLGVEQPATVGAAAATAPPAESRPGGPHAEQRGAEEPAQMEEEQEHGGAPVPSLAIASPTLKKIALAVCGVLAGAFVVYWATRPEQLQVATQTPAVQTQASSPPPTGETSLGSAVAEKAAAVKQPAAESLSTQAMYEKGNDYYFGRGVSKDYKQAYSWFRKAAEAGSADGMANLGVMYEHGYGVDKDYKQALAWNRKAVAAGNASGMNNLGFMYRNGLGVDKDYPKAVSYFRKAAERGSAFGMDNLAEMYENGYGVRKDPQQAISWYRKAAQLGDQYAKDALERLADKAAADQAAADKVAADKAAADKATADKAAAAKPPATESLSAQAMNDKGQDYYYGRGVSISHQQAVSWYRKAAEAGNAEGMNNLGAMYENGEGVEKDRQQAIFWYRKAAQLGNQHARDALERLGVSP